MMFQPIKFLTVMLLFTPQLIAQDFDFNRLGFHKVIVVKADDWQTPLASLSLFERRKDTYVKVKQGVSVTIGRKGLGWGVGLHPGKLPKSQPIKEEGDKKAPAGIFRLSHAMGYAEEGIGEMQYEQATPHIICVDDSASDYYNQIFDRRKIKEKDWTSHEEMRRKDNLYKWLIVAEHNLDGAVEKAGSCIFLHLWSAPGKGTAGCTAMAEEQLTDILSWIKEGEKVALVQMPEKVYSQLKPLWKLP